VKNVFETPVSSDQFESRAILKGFAVAASRAQSLYGSDVKQLDKPIVVQVVQLDSKRIQFGVFQLNTLDLDNDNAVKNYWFRKPEMYLYDDCYYHYGRPALTAYNFDVFRLMNVFYSS
jgi:large subunit ribosomal protein L37